MKNKYLWMLVIVALFGLLIRVIFIDKYPPGISWDEISHGYSAYSILKTGTDEWGFLPLSNFRAYGDYPLALNLYLTIPFIVIFGLSEFSVRFPHALMGGMTIVAGYYLALGLSKSKRVSLLTAILIAIEPYHLFFSRFAAQSNLAVFFLTASAAAFFNRKKNKYLIPVSILSLGLTLYSYHTTRIISPIIIIFATIIFFVDIKSQLKDLKVRLICLIILAILFLPLPFILLRPEARARSNEVFLLNQGTVNQIIEQRQNSKYPEIATRLIYNRPTYFVTHVVKNHLDYYLPDFLFFKGGTHYQFSIPNRGLLYLVNLPFFYLGLFLVIKKALKGDKKYIFVLLWFLIAPLPGSITKERFAVMRGTGMLPLPQIMSAIGFFAFLEFLRKKNKAKSSNSVKLLIVVYSIFMLINVKNYISSYIGEYAGNYSQDRQYGYKEVVNFAKNHYGEYDNIIMTKKYGEPHEFFLFFWPWDPASYKSDPNLNRFYQSNWYWVDGFDKFYFVNDWQINEKGSGNYTFNLESGGAVQCTPRMFDCLLITSPGNVPEGWNKLETVKFLNGHIAFEIYEN